MGNQSYYDCYYVDMGYIKKIYIKSDIDYVCIRSVYNKESIRILIN